METATLTADDTVAEVVRSASGLTTCPFCKRLGEDVHVDAWLKKIDTHLVITISDYGTKDEHCHLHGCTDNKQAMLKVMEYIKNEINKHTEK